MIRIHPTDLREAIRNGQLSPYEVAPRAKVSEAELLRLAIAVAQGLGWRVAHFRPARMRSGRWATPVQGDAAGFPDLVLVRNGQIICCELKSHQGRLTPEQRAWLDALGEVPGVTVCVVRPLDWHVFVDILHANKTVQSV